MHLCLHLRGLGGRKRFLYWKNMERVPWSWPKKVVPEKFSPVSGSRKGILMTNKFNKDDYFKIDPEAHLVGESQPFEYFPGVNLWWHSIAAIKRPMMLGMPKSFMETLEPHELQKDADPASLIGSDGQVWGGYRLPAAGINDGHYRLYWPVLQ